MVRAPIAFDCAPHRDSRVHIPHLRSPACMRARRYEYGEAHLKPRQRRPLKQATSSSLFWLLVFCIKYAMEHVVVSDLVRVRRYRRPAAPQPPLDSHASCLFLYCHVASNHRVSSPPPSPPLSRGRSPSTHSSCSPSRRRSASSTSTRCRSSPPSCCASHSTCSSSWQTCSSSSHSAWRSSVASPPRETRAWARCACPHASNARAAGNQPCACVRCS